MKNGFKWILMLTATIAMCSLAACGGDDDDSTQQGTVPENPNNPNNPNNPDNPNNPNNPNNPDIPTVYTLLEAQDAEDGTKVNINESTVVAMSTKSLLLKDNSGYMQVWYTEDPGLKEGNTLTLSGTVQTQNGMKSIAAGAEIAPVDTDTPVFTQPDAKELTDAMIAATPTVEYVTYTGTVEEGGYIVADNSTATRKVRFQDPLAHLNITTGTKLTVEGYTVGATDSTLELMVVTTEVYSDAAYRVWLRDETSTMDVDFTDDANLKFPAEGGMSAKKLYIYVDGTDIEPEVTCSNAVVEYIFEVDDSNKKTFIVDEQGSKYPHYTLFVNMPANTSTQPVVATLTIKVGNVTKSCNIEQDGKVEGIDAKIWLVNCFDNLNQFEAKPFEEGKNYEIFKASSDASKIVLSFAMPSAANGDASKTTDWYAGLSSSTLRMWPGDSVTFGSDTGKVTFKKIELYEFTTSDVTADKGTLENGILTNFKIMPTDYDSWLTPVVWTGSEKSVTFTAKEGVNRFSWVAIRLIYTEEK